MLAVLTVTSAGENQDIDPFGNGQLTLREAIAYVNGVTVPDGDNSPPLISGVIGQPGQVDKIIFAPGLIGDPIALQHGALLISRSVEIEGPGAALLTLDATASTGSVFVLNDLDANHLIDVAISGLTLTGGDAGLNSDGGVTTRGGGAIFSVENLALADIHAVDNVADSSGGALHHAHGSLSIVDSVFDDNHSTNSSGGALFVQGGVGAGFFCGAA